MKKVGYDELKKFCLNFDELRPVMMDPHHMKEGLWVASDSRVLIIVEEGRCKSDIANEVKKSKKKNELLYKYFKGEYPKVFEIFDPYEHKYKNQLKYTHTITLAALEDALGKVPMIEEQKEVINNVDAIECPCCDGEGELEEFRSFEFKGEWRHITFTAECPFCHGTGKVPDDADYHCDDWGNPKDYYSVSMVGTGKFVKDIKGAVFDVNGRWYKAEYIQKIAEFMGAFGIEEIKVGHKGDALIWTAGWVHFMLMRITEPDENIWRGKVEVEPINE